MPTRSLASALGVPPALERLYRQLQAADGGSVEEAAAGLMRTPAQLLAELEPLLRRGVVRVEAGVLRVASPQEALALVMAEESRALTEAASRIARVARAVPHVVQEPARKAFEDAGAVDADVLVGGNMLDILVPWIEQGHGEVRFLRPDQWRLPSESAMSAAVTTAVQQGRRVRAIYPALALREAPEVLSARAAIGEQVRVLPEVPTRLAIVGSNRALFPDPPGPANERRIMMRHPGVVALLTDWFDRMWDSAVALPRLAGGERQHDVRRLLLAELARGARDEQIARTLGMSLRTVRRRIAELMVELGADSRFQAGLEAARRGWV